MKISIPVLSCNDCPAAAFPRCLLIHLLLGPCELSITFTVSLYLLNDNKVMVDVGDGAHWRIIKASRNHFQLRSVMCRELGRGPPILPGYTLDRNFSFHGDFIWADAFLCTGWESELSECPWTIVNRSASENRWLYYSEYFMQLNCLPPQAKGMCNNKR